MTGAVSELRTKARLLDLGYQVFVPLIDLPFDVLINSRVGIYSKIQVKTCTRMSPQDRKKHFRIKIENGQGKQYGKVDVDFFIGVQAETFYVIPIEKVLASGNRSCYLPDGSDRERWDLLPPPPGEVVALVAI